LGARVGVVGAGEVYAVVAVTSQDSSHATSAAEFAVDYLQTEGVLQHDLLL
jgi:molybdopterin synthase catalytic subunit